MRHIREPHAQLVYIGADKWIGRPKGYMVGKHHEISGRKGRIDAAGSIG